MQGNATPTGGERDRFAAWLLASVSLLAVIGDFFPAYPDWITGVIGWTACLLLWHRVKSLQRRVILLLLGFGLAGVVWGTLAGKTGLFNRALTQNLNLVGMLIAVSFLQLIGARTGGQDEKFSTGPGALFRTLIGVHIFGAVINYSAVAIFADRLSARTRLSMDQAVALSQSFIIGAVWSPFYGAMAVALTFAPGARHALIGPNGAGKTTFFNVITGLYTPDGGTFELAGQPYRPQSVHLVAKAGIARTFQNIRLFPEMTALENVIVGCEAHSHTGVISAMLRTRAMRREESEFRARALELLTFMGIADRADDAAKNLPYGYQRRLEIARALATQPKLLCLDEPAAGFNPAEKQELMGLIRSIRDQGYTVLLIEHDMNLVMGVTDRIVVLDFGRQIAEGTPAEVRSNPAVIAAYLGEPDVA